MIWPLFIVENSVNEIEGVENRRMPPSPKPFASFSNKLRKPRIPEPVTLNAAPGLPNFCSIHSFLPRNSFQMCFLNALAPLTFLSATRPATDRSRFYFSTLLLVPPFLLLRCPDLLFAAIFTFEPFVSVKIEDVMKNASQNNLASINRKRNTRLFQRCRCRRTPSRCARPRRLCRRLPALYPTLSHALNDMF
jgi:hypothetical protein